jgi:phytoene synthase
LSKSSLLANIEYEHELREIISYHSKTFYFATQFLPSAKRIAIWSLYAFCRSTDDLIDCQPNKTNQELINEIDDWKADLLSDEPNHKILAHFKTVIETYQIPIQYALDLIEGCKRDLTQKRYTDFAELSNYCYQVASTVGLMSIYIIGFDKNYQKEVEENAIKAGIALQMTNILRDVGEDLQRGRIYIPLKDFESCNCNPGQPEKWKDSKEFYRLLYIQMQRTKNLYAESWKGLKFLNPLGKFAVGVALTIYEGILPEIEKNQYDVLEKRAFVSFWKKLFLVFVTGWKLLFLK